MITSPNAPYKKPLLFLVLLVLVGGAVLYLMNGRFSQNENGVACTLDARQCTDGSYVGRGGPECRFDACPGEEKREDGVTFQYPRAFWTKYVSVGAEGWPPTAHIEEQEVGCFDDFREPNTSGTYGQREIDGNRYCVDVKAEGAAGSIYKTYSYLAGKEGKQVTFRFTLRYPQCANYDEPERSVCTSEQEMFDVDAMVAEMFASLKFE